MQSGGLRARRPEQRARAPLSVGVRLPPAETHSECEACRPSTGPAGFLYYDVPTMQKSIHDILQMIETPLISFTVVVLSCVCFLLSLWIIMIMVRLVVG